MGAGRGQTRRVKATAGPPDVLAGDWVEITASGPTALMPLYGAVAEVASVEQAGELSVIVGGKLSTGLSWGGGDRWKKILPPTDLPISWVRSDAAPSAGLATAHSWRDREAATHPLVVGKGDFDGWLKISGDPEAISAVDAAQAHVMETGGVDGWSGDEATYPQVKQIDFDAWDPVQVRKVEELAELLSEADCMDDGFILHNYGDGIELRMNGAEDLKGLEAVVEGFEGLDLQVEEEVEDEEEAVEEAALDTAELEKLGLNEQGDYGSSEFAAHEDKMPMNYTFSMGGNTHSLRMKVVDGQLFLEQIVIPGKRWSGWGSSIEGAFYARRATAKNLTEASKTFQKYFAEVEPLLTANLEQGVPAQLEREALRTYMAWAYNESYATEHQAELEAMSNDEKRALIEPRVREQMQESGFFDQESKPEDYLLF